MTEKPHFTMGGAVSLAVVAYLLVLAGGLLIVGDPAWSLAEGHLVAAVNAAHAPFPDAIAHTLNFTFGPFSAAILTAVLAVGAGFIFRSWAASARVFVLVAVPWALSYLLKLIVGRPRPNPVGLVHGSGIEPSTLSYPSGHTAFAAAIMVALVLVVVHRFHQHRRSVIVAAIAATIVVVLITGWSRIYLGVHYPTDVLASIILVPASVIAIDRLLTGIIGTPLSGRTAKPLAEEADPPARPSSTAHSLPH